jgi:WRKY transcription factor 33
MTSFTDLLAGNGNMDSNNQGRITHGWGYSDQKSDRIGVDVPKFKSLQPSSLPFSPAPVSPSSYFAISPGFSPTDFLSSPLFPSYFSVSYIFLSEWYI